jgi:hypothetical protein
VRIYKATPEVVYVGYTPGYTNTYVYHTTIVYGTGYSWPGWYGRWYYPRPATWGFHVRWNPWTGWGFGFSYGSGPFRFTIGFGSWYRGGWWGPSRYRGYRRGYRHGYRRGRHAGYRAGYRAGQRRAGKENIYRNQRNQGRMTAQAKTAGTRARAATASGRANNVFADRNGDIHRKTDQGWQKRSKDGWESRKGQRPEAKPSRTQRPQSKPSTTQRPQSKPSKSQLSSRGTAGTQQLDRSHKARQRGQQRSRSYNRSRGRGGRGGRGGGRR